MNTTLHTNLILDIVRSQFGSKVAKVVSFLLLKPATLYSICRSVDLPHTDVKHCLIVLLQFNVLHYTLDTPTVYSLDEATLLFSLKFPHYLAFVQAKFGDVAKEVTKVVMLYGMLNFSDILSLLQMTQPYPEELIREAFQSLVTSKLLVRITTSVTDSIDRTSTPAPSFSNVLPKEVKKHARKRAHPDVPLERPTAKKRADVAEQEDFAPPPSDSNFADSSLWRLNPTVFFSETVKNVRSRRPPSAGLTRRRSSSASFPKSTRRRRSSSRR